MRYYIYDKDDGEVHGPMSEKDAEEMKASAPEIVIMFTETIFEPEADRGSNPLITSRAIEQTLKNLQDLQEGQPSASYWANKEGLAHITCQWAIDVITSLFAKKVVTGSIEGGVLNLGEVPEGVSVEIRDYDVDGSDDDLEEDEEGHKFVYAG